MDLAEAFQSRPGRGFANDDIWIVWDERLSMRGIDHADSEACAHQGIECGDFVFVERKHLVVSRKQSRGGRKRIFVAEDRVGRGNGGFANCKTNVHIAEIDHAEDTARKRPGGRDERIVIVRVAVDDAAAEMGKLGNGFGFKKVEELFGESSSLRILNMGKIRASPERAGEIPFELAVSGGMREIKESGIDFGEKTT